MHKAYVAIRIDPMSLLVVGASILGEFPPTEGPGGRWFKRFTTTGRTFQEAHDAAVRIIQADPDLLFLFRRFRQYPFDSAAKPVTFASR